MTIPCKNCITLSICKARLDIPTTYTDVMMRLYPICSLLKEHLKSEHSWSTYDYSPTKVDSVVHFYNVGHKYMYSIKET